MDATDGDYSQWSVEKLVERVKILEKELRDSNTKHKATEPPKQSVKLSYKQQKSRERRAFDHSKHTTRYIALKFAYLGQGYNGYEYHKNTGTRLPTVEEVLWKALVKGRLILPTDVEAMESGKLTWEGCDYSKCGRTDRGVSAFGQVIGLRVRSNRPQVERKEQAPTEVLKASDSEGVVTTLSDSIQDEYYAAEDIVASDQEQAPDFDPIRDEIPYPRVLNRILPPDIRVLAWCPNPPAGFSARFSCRERRYRYFFTQPAFNPTFGRNGVMAGLTADPITGERRREGWLDIEAMQDAAKRFEGLHDFRNFCKVDASKQIYNFMRRVFRSEISEVLPESLPAANASGSLLSEYSGSTVKQAGTASFEAPQNTTPKTYQFVLHGSAFLWHQVRHMIAILFLIGQGLEKPELISQLLDTKLTPRKPIYEMATDAPLVLWDCIFPAEASGSRDDALDWVWIGDECGADNEQSQATSGFKGLGKYGYGGVIDELWELWRKKKMDEVLAGSLLNVAIAQGRNSDVMPEQPRPQHQKTYFGGDSYEHRGAHVTVMQRGKQEAAEEVNARWLARKGAAAVEKGGRGKLEWTRERERRTDHLEEEVVE